MKYVKWSIVSSIFLITHFANAQNAKRLDNQVNLLFGVSQVTLGGFNVEANLAFDRFIVDYSHGVSLNLSNDFLENGPDKAQNLAIHIPWTTGLGLGYRLNDWLNVRVEPKWHRFELYQEGDPQTVTNLIGEYTTFTLGLGMYANFRPFKHKNSFLKGIMIVPNIRWWPRVSSSLADNTLDYYNRTTNQTETHTAREIGINNTPFFFNLSVGYSHTF